MVKPINSLHPIAIEPEYKNRPQIYRFEGAGEAKNLPKGAWLRSRGYIKVHINQKGHPILPPFSAHE